MECRQDTPEQMEFDDVQPARVTYQPERKSRRPKEEKKKAKTVREEEPQDKREQLQRQMSEMSYPKIGTIFDSSSLHISGILLYSN
jgi:hypothetical protein